MTQADLHRLALDLAARAPRMDRAVVREEMIRHLVRYIREDGCADALEAFDAAMGRGRG